MKVPLIKYTAKFIGKALLSGFRFNRIKQARNISMDLSSKTVSDNTQAKIDDTNTGFSYLDGDRVVTRENGELLHLRWGR